MTQAASSRTDWPEQPRRALISFWRRILTGDGYTWAPGGQRVLAESQHYGVSMNREHVHNEPPAYYFEDEGSSDRARAFIQQREQGTR